MEKLVRDISVRYESRYFKYLDTSLHLHHLVDLGTRLMIAKLWRMVYDQSRNIPAPLGGEEIKKRLLVCNTEVVDMARQLPERSARFGWFFCRYMLWHAIVFLFVELYNRNEGTGIDRAWTALEAVFEDYKDENGIIHLSGVKIKKSMLWQPLQKNFKQAQDLHREATSRTQVDELCVAYTRDLGDNITHVPIQASENSSMWDHPFLGAVPDVGVEMNWVDWNSIGRAFKMIFSSDKSPAVKYPLKSCFI